MRLITAIPRAERATWPSARAPAFVASLGLSAYAMGVARGSPDYWWVGWVVLLPLLVSIRVLAPVKAMAAGAFWGLCVFVSLFLASGPEPEFAGGVGSLILLTVVPGVYAYLGARLTRRIGFSPYLLALGWMGVELALSPIGLRSGLLAGTQGDGVVIHWLGNFAGCALVAFLVAYVSATVFEALRRVCAGDAARAFVTTPPHPPPRLFPQETFSDLFDLIRPARPRAPPMGLSA